jgi:hypothetical protein
MRDDQFVELFDFLAILILDRDFDLAAFGPLNLGDFGVEDRRMGQMLIDALVDRLGAIFPGPEPELTNSRWW